MFYSGLLIVEVIIALMLIGLVLMQQGKGADAGAAFGSGASGTVFGASGAGNFLTRATAFLAFLFMLNSLGLAYIISHRSSPETDVIESVIDKVGGAGTNTPGDVPVDNSLPASSGSLDVPTDVPGSVELAPTNGSDVPSDVPGSDAVNSLLEEADQLKNTLKENAKAGKEAISEDVISVGEAIKGKADAAVDTAKEAAKEVAKEAADKVVPTDVPQQ